MAKPGDVADVETPRWRAHKMPFDQSMHETHQDLAPIKSHTACRVGHQLRRAHARRRTPHIARQCVKVVCEEVGAHCLRRGTW